MSDADCVIRFIASSQKRDQYEKVAQNEMKSKQSHDENEKKKEFVDDYLFQSVKKKDLTKKDCALPFDNKSKERDSRERPE